MAVLHIETTDNMLATVNALSKAKNPAFANFFRNYVEANNGRSDEWNASLWETWGFTIKGAKFEVIDEKKYAIFLLKWS